MNLLPVFAIAALLHRNELLVCAVVSEAGRRGIDPVVVVALVEHESGFCLQAFSATHDYGLMQIHEPIHGRHRAPAANIRKGVGRGYVSRPVYVRGMRGSEGEVIHQGRPSLPVAKGGVMDYIETAIARIKEFCPPEGYWLAFSGGKDSQCIYHLAEMSCVPFDAHYAVTTIDPPPLVRFIRKQYPKVIFEHPEKPFLKLLETKGFPFRQARWCCELYKERGGEGRTVLLGVRWEESAARAKRKMVQKCFKGGRMGYGDKTYVSPIIDWTVDQVWEFLNTNDIPHCELYDLGWNRIGCLMCPYAGDKARMREATMFPRYRDAFIKSFEVLHSSGRDSMKRWKNGRDMFWWWIGNPDEEKQQELFT